MKNVDYDLIFLHAGGRNKKGLQGPHIPIGVLGLASYLRSLGYRVKIINLLLEQILDHTVTEQKILEELRCPIFCVDLHWFVHAYESISLTEEIKKIHPGALCILGGLTSSYFAEEIMESFSSVDMIVKGESETPLKMVLESWKTDHNFEKIPNIIFRKNNRIINRPISYNIHQSLLDDIDFLDFEAVKNWRYLFQLNNVDYQYDRSDREVSMQDYLARTPNMYPVYTGRGCTFNCSFCGGSANAFKKCFNRERIILRDPSRVAEDILKLDSLGVIKTYIPHSPLIINNDYHHNLLDALKRTGKVLNIGFYFEDFPFYFDPEINQKYAEIFNPCHSLYRVYVGHINERISKLNQCYIPISRIAEIQNFCKSSGITLKLCFILGMPGEDYSTTIEQCLYIKKCIASGWEVEIYKAEMHPAGNIYTNPQKYGVTHEISGFLGYYQFLKSKNNKSMFYGYQLKSKLTPDEQYNLVLSIIDLENKPNLKDTA